MAYRNAVKEGTENHPRRRQPHGPGGKGCRSRRHRHRVCGKPSLRYACGLEVLSRPSDGREAVDRKSLMLPDEDLVKLVLKANPNTILVLVSSFPHHQLEPGHVPAIVHITHCSQGAGQRTGRRTLSAR